MLYNYSELIVATPITDVISVGNWSDAVLASHHNLDTLCVIETPIWQLPKNNTYYVPILAHDEERMQKRFSFEPVIPEIPPRALRKQLDRCAEIIRTYEQDQKKLLVHCYEGRERSPLTVAYWLVKSGLKKDLDEAYVFLQEKRPIVEDRRGWIEMDTE
jgi:protein-tyrosine phosphatase